VSLEVKSRKLNTPFWQESVYVIPDKKSSSASQNSNETKQEISIENLKNAIKRRDILVIEQCFTARISAKGCDFNDLIIDLVYRAKTDEIALDMLHWMEQGIVDFSVTRRPMMNELGKLNEKEYTFEEVIIYKDFLLTLNALKLRQAEKNVDDDTWYFACYYGSSNILNDLIRNKKFLSDYQIDGVPLLQDKTPLIIAIKGLIHFQNKNRFLNTVKCLLLHCPEMILMDTTEQGNTYLPYQLVLMEEAYEKPEFFMIIKTIKQSTKEIQDLMNKFKKNTNRTKEYTLQVENLLRQKCRLLGTACDELDIQVYSLEIAPSLKQVICKSEEFQKEIEKFVSTHNLKLNEDDINDVPEGKNCYGLS
jgi:hypothetical protein